jgi:hypothetical protein
MQMELNNFLTTLNTPYIQTWMPMFEYFDKPLKG